MNENVNAIELLEKYEESLGSEYEKKIILSHPLEIKQLLLFDFQVFRNKYNTTSLLIRSLFIPLTILILISIIISFLSIFSNSLFFCLAGICRVHIELTSVYRIENIISAYLLVFGGTFWELQKIFSQKWHYCANIFNMIAFKVETLSLDKAQNELKRWEDIKHRLLLCMDVLQMTLWNNESFDTEFRNHLEFSIKIFSLDSALELEKLYSGKMTEKEACEYLFTFQSFCCNIISEIISKYGNGNENQLRETIKDM